MISVQGKFLCNNITEGFTFFRYNRDTKFERGTKHWQKEWQVSIKKDVLPLGIAIFGGNKFFCNHLCGRGKLFSKLG